MTLTKKLLLLVLVVVLLSAAVAWGVALAPYFRIEAMVKELQESDHPVIWSEFHPDPVPDQDNVAEILASIYGRSDALNEQVAEVLMGSNRGNPRALARELRQLFDDHQDVLESIFEAARSEHYATQLYLPADDEQMSFAELVDVYIRAVELPRRLRRANRILDDLMEVQLIEGEYNQAVETGIAMLRLVRHFEQEPYLICFMTSLAYIQITTDGISRALESNTVSPETLRHLDDELARHNSAEPFRQVMLVERAWTVEFFRSFHRQAWKMWSPLNAIEYLSHRGYFSPTTFAEYLADMEELIKYEGGPEDLEAMRREVVQWGDSNGVTVMSLSSVMSDLAAPARAIRQRFADSRAELRCLRVLAAIYRLGLGDADEIEIDELDLPPEATRDPYGDGPINIVRTAAGWKVYSVGLNGIDEGGDEASDDVVVPGPSIEGWHRSDPSPQTDPTSG